MLGGMNQRQMGQMLKKMGVNQVDIDATQVIITTPTKTIYIDQPQVAKVSMMGQTSFQITGAVREEERTVVVSQEDIQTVISQTQVTPERAKELLIQAQGDIAQAILFAQK
jgi:nascent polypeptide-associated complex subunit alpha